MKWEKPANQILEIFEKIVPDIAGIERRRMFGLPVAFVNSNMYMGVHQSTVILRLSESDREEFLRLKSATMFEPSPGRKMKEYVTIPSWMFEEQHDQVLKEWVHRSFEYVSVLPPKEKKKEKKKK